MEFVEAIRTRKNLIARSSAQISIVRPPIGSPEYNTKLAALAARMLFENPCRSPTGCRLFIINVSVLSSVNSQDYDELFPYLAYRLPGEAELLAGTEYEILLYAGDITEDDSSSQTKAEGAQPSSAASSSTPGPAFMSKSGPVWPWVLRSYRSLPRIMRKRLRQLYVVHERGYIRWMFEMFSTIASGKFRKKLHHFSSLTALGQVLPLENLIIPSIVVTQDRKVADTIKSPHSLGPRAFGVYNPLPVDVHLRSRLPRVLREATQFLLLGDNLRIQGIFRVPGSGKMRDYLREAYDRGQKYIMWKEKDDMVPHPDYVNGHLIRSDEIDSKDFFGPTTAASLVKFWYFTLRQPLVPPECYKAVSKIAVNDGIERSERVKQLAGVFAPRAFDSPFTHTAREIFCGHLIPMMAHTATFEAENQMPPRNLAVCIGPALLRGGCQAEDVQVLILLHRLLEEVFTLWDEPDGLRQACGIPADKFLNDLRHPDNVDDYEDPEDLKEEVMDAMGTPSPQSARDGQGQSRPNDPISGHITQIIQSPFKRKPIPGLSLPLFPTGILSSISTYAASLGSQALAGSADSTPSPADTLSSIESGIENSRTRPRGKSVSAVESPASTTSSQSAATTPRRAFFDFSSLSSSTQARNESGRAADSGDSGSKSGGNRPSRSASISLPTGRRMMERKPVPGPTISTARTGFGTTTTIAAASPVSGSPTSASPSFSLPFGLGRRSTPSASAGSSSTSSPSVTTPTPTRSRAGSMSLMESVIRTATDLTRSSGSSDQDGKGSEKGPSKFFAKAFSKSESKESKEPKDPKAPKDGPSPRGS